MSKTTNPATEPSVSSGFYDSDLAARDRKYYASDLNKLVSGIITDGVFMNIGECLLVTAAGGNTVSVGSGKAWFNDHWIINDAGLPIECEPAERALNRIDAIVIEINDTEPIRDGFIKYIKGPVDGGEAVRPTLTNEEKVHQHALCYINRPMESTEITNQDIEIVVGLDKETPFVTSVLETGTIEGYFASWEEQFVNWFENVKYNMSGDVAMNLQLQIDDNTEDIDELKEITSDLVFKDSSLQLMGEYTSPGAYEFTPDHSFMGFVVIVGAGGSGARTYQGQCSGGGGGAVIVTPLMFFDHSTPINIIVGAGGKPPDNSSTSYNGFAGGTSSALGFAATGGSGGLSSSGSNGGRVLASLPTVLCRNYSGGNPEIYTINGITLGLAEPAYCHFGPYGGIGAWQSSSNNYNGYDGENIADKRTSKPFSAIPLPENFFTAGGGGGGQANRGPGKGGVCYFGKGGDGSSNVNTPGGDGSTGCGGGGAYGYGTSSGGSSLPGCGGDGYVAIYEVAISKVKE